MCAFLLVCIGWQKFYSEEENDTNTEMKWGTFLPHRVQSLLLNMSRYFYDDLLAADSYDRKLSNQNFFAACKIFIQTSKKNELFEQESPVKMSWNFL